MLDFAENTAYLFKRFSPVTVEEGTMIPQKLNDPLVESVVKKISEAIQPEKIILFGSRAKSAGRSNSDIDLLIIKEPTTSKRDLKLHIRRLFSRQNFSMDLFILTPEEFRRQQLVANTIARTAVREGRVCYG